MRMTYEEPVFVKMAVRALKLWRKNCARWKCKLFHPIGVLWMAHENDKLEKAAIESLREARLPFEQLTVQDAEKRFAQINFEGVRWTIYEKNSGYLSARRACQTVLEAFMAEGGDYRQGWVFPGAIEAGRMRGLKLPDGSNLMADRYVFACGPWLPKIFPEIIGNRIAPTRQPVFFFGPPAGNPRFFEEHMPVWIDHGERYFYGIPGNEWRGFKVADDTRGASFDPTEGERVPSQEEIQSVRRYMEFRFPGLKGAPLVEARVCQYEDTPDHRFIVDRHPEARNVWIIGGGSGHGFKHGPALGEMVSELVLKDKPQDPVFSLARFSL